MSEIWKQGVRRAMEKKAMDPMTAAGLAFGGKMLGSNLLIRHGMNIAIPWTKGRKLRPIRRGALEIMGVGARTAMQGKPGLSKATREAASLIGDPHAVDAYEKARSVGKALRGLKPGDIKSIDLRADLVEKHPHLRHLAKDIKRHAELISDVPMESKGWRKGVDYMFTPVGQVAKDVKRKILRQKKPPEVLGPETGTSFKARAEKAMHDFPENFEKMRVARAKKVGP